MDILADVLSVLQLRTQTYFCSVFSDPWGIEVRQEDKVGIFHVVLEGECWLDVENRRDPIRLTAGDIVALPTGGNHAIGDEYGRNQLSSDSVLEHIHSGENPFQNQSGMKTTLLCGEFKYDTSIDHPFLVDLPCLIHVKSGEDEDDWLHPLIAALARENQNIKSGSSVIIKCLTEVLFVHLLRAYMKQSDNNNFRYMSALVHPTIGIALKHIHNDTKAQCSVEKIADALAMSRTNFTDKFTRVVGMPPKKYLINWRMQKAKSQLLVGKESMIAVAERAGYQSEAAFNKAYKKFFGETPGATKAR